MEQGKFIVFEGIDGCGGTSHASLTVDWLTQQGFNVVLTKEPTDTEIGNLLRLYLTNGAILPETDALLFASDRVEHSRWILDRINQGQIVISDRYLESSIAYQAAQRLPVKWILNLNRYCHLPDLNILLYLDPEIAIQRKLFTDKFEKINFLKQVQKNYLHRAKANTSNWKIIDSSSSIETVQQKIEVIIKDFLQFEEHE